MTQFNWIAGAACAPKGFFVSAVCAGIRYSRNDLTLIASETPAVAAGVLTTNHVHAWCVAHNRERLVSGTAQAIVCNAGCANACNGARGKEDDHTMSSAISEALKQRFKSDSITVLTASTGTIGPHLPIDKVKNAVPELIKGMGNSTDDGTKAAQAIMTTDLVPKYCAIEFPLGGEKVRIGGMAKGSGMIAPNMATMLGFITTDVAIDHKALQPMLRRVVDRTFNSITVDGDTSTNDMVLVLANGASGAKASEDLATFEEALHAVCLFLSKSIARDGEGATKLIAVHLKNPPPNGHKIAKTIAESPLVKTACFGNDPNWGRILAAAGRAGVPFDPRGVVVRLAGFEVFRNGEPTTFDPKQVSAAMKVKELEIELEFSGNPKGDLTVWTCDFSYDYVKINADYTT